MLFHANMDACMVIFQRQERIPRDYASIIGALAV